MAAQKTVIIIVGPTASGKTNLSLELAQHFNTEIISADSRQCYREMNIGVAKPPEEALKKIRHHFINSHSIHDDVNANVFEQYALDAADKIFKQNDFAVMVGGTGMYIKAFCEGMDEMPEINSSVRNEIINAYKQNGLAWLQNEIKIKDPEFWKIAEQKNPQRLIRALEVHNATGKSILHFKRNKKKERSFNVVKTGIEIAKEKLHQNINARVDEMIEAGLVNEVSQLLPFKHLNALQTVGYKEMFNHLEGNISLAEAIEKIKTNTKQYAKRQLTWFKKDKDIRWISCDHLKNIQGINIFLSGLEYQKV